MTYKDALILLNAIDDTDYLPNQWEVEFIKSIRLWVERKHKPTDKQAEVINKIYGKATEN